MRRRFEGLHHANQSEIEIPEGLFLVRVARAKYYWHPQKPYYSVRLSVLEPTLYAGVTVTSRIFCTRKALWKLNWFLREFGYDVDLLGNDEIEDKRLVGLTGVVKISRVVVNGTALLNLDGFAPAVRWQELAPSTENSESGSEVA